MPNSPPHLFDEGESVGGVRAVVVFRVAAAVVADVGRGGHGHGRERTVVLGEEDFEFFQAKSFKLSKFANSIIHVLRVTYVAAASPGLSCGGGGALVAGGGRGDPAAAFSSADESESSSESTS